MRLGLAAALMLSLVTAEARAGQVCAWLTEKNKPDDVHAFELWLKADKPLDFLYQIGGAGVTAEGFKAHSPGSGTFQLSPGKPDKVWGFGTTMPTPAKIDITIELHDTPADIFSDAPTPLITKFAFARAVPGGEKKAPPSLAAKQCNTIP